MDNGGDPLTKMQTEIVTSVRPRRRWSRAEKERTVAAAMEPGAVASAVARGGRNTSEPAVSLAPAIAWCCAVCIVNVRGSNRRCADNRVADVAGSDRSGAYDWSAVADLRSCGCRDCSGGHTGSDRLLETVTIPDLRGF